MSNENQSRRDFLSTVTLGAMGSIGAASLLSSCKGTETAGKMSGGPAPSLTPLAPDGRPLKAGLVGCGGRGSGAAVNFVDAGPNLEIIALGDVFQDQMEKCRHGLKAARDIEVAEENCFVGFDSYKKVIDSGVDIVLFATPPHFRPEHVKAAVEAGKHVFQEKPLAVDPFGAREMALTIEKAKANNICMVSGTIRRYQKDFVETRRRALNGAIGDIISASIIRNGGALWWIERKPEWSDMEYMLRNWGNYNWLSGDLIVEQFIHEIDVMNWYVGGHPVKAMGYGGREQRISGDLFDHFSIVYEYEDGRRVHCASRQINGCDNRKDQLITGTKGYADASGAIYNNKGEMVWEYPYPEEDATDSAWQVRNPYVQEHLELVTAIRTGNYINDAESILDSTRIGIMGRMSAYTGKDVTWEEVLNSDLHLGPRTYEFGSNYNIPKQPPVVGTSPSSVDRYA